MSDLVKRLRDYGGQSYDECTDTWLAADEIERLTSECEQWVRRCDTAMVERQMWRETAEAAQAENARLRKALKEIGRGYCICSRAEDARAALAEKEEK